MPSAPRLRLLSEELLEQPQEVRSVLIADPHKRAFRLLADCWRHGQQQPLRPLRDGGVPRQLFQRVELERVTGVRPLEHHDDAQRLQLLLRELGFSSPPVEILEGRLEFASAGAAVSAALDVANFRIAAAPAVKLPGL